MFLQDHLTQYFVILLYVHRPFTLNTPHSKFLNYFLLRILVSLTYLRALCKLSMTTNFSVNSQWAAKLFYINRAFLFQDPSSCLLPFLKEMRPPSANAWETKIILSRNVTRDLVHRCKFHHWCWTATRQCCSAATTISTTSTTSSLWCYMVKTKNMPPTRSVHQSHAGPSTGRDLHESDDDDDAFMEPPPWRRVLKKQCTNANVAANATAKVQHSNLVPHLGASRIIVITCFWTSFLSLLARLPRL